MMSEMNLSDNAPVIDTSITLDSSNSLRGTNALMISYLYEVSYLNEDDKISNAHFPLVDPYSAFVKPASFSPIRSIKKLIQHTRKEVEEYVQSTQLDQHRILATQQEHFIACKCLMMSCASGLLKAILTCTLVLFA